MKMQWMIPGILCAVLLVAVQGVFAAEATQEKKQPPVISAPPGAPPSDAVVLFDGQSLREWTFRDGSPATWPIENGAFAVVRESGGIQTRREFGSFQLHLEFATPNPPVGESQGRGNSGVYLHGSYEVQVLDSYENETYPDGMAAAIYLQHIPLVNPSRKPGEWQTYDIIFHAPVFNTYEERADMARVTVLFNGVLVQDNVTIDGPTAGAVRPDEARKGPIYIQDHSNPVLFRNVWLRELK